MTPLFVVGIVAASLAALVNWYGVLRGDLRLERPSKAAVPAILIALVLLSDPEASFRSLLLGAALASSLAGDWLLLPPERFTAGLAAFLLAHVAYLVVFALGPLDAGLAGLGLLGAAALLLVVGRRILAGATRAGVRRPVAVYLGVISLMAIAATASGSALAALGAWLFVASDARLGWNRFVSDDPDGAPMRTGLDRLTVMVPYHAAQVLLTAAILLAHAS